MTDHEEQSVIDRLKAYNKQFDDLLALLEGIPLGREGKDRARQLLKALKDGLRRDFKVGDSTRGQSQMTQAEKQCFYPAVHQAHAEIHVAWNSVPSGKWLSELYGAQINITHMLHDLEN